MTNQEYAKKLRELADLYDAHEDLVQPHTIKNDGYDFVFCEKDTFGAAIKAFGSGTKTTDESGIIYSPKRFPFLRLYLFHHAVCERVVTGSKYIPAQPERVIAAVPAHMEEIVEWHCPDSFLALSEATPSDTAETAIPDEVFF